MSNIYMPGMVSHKYDASLDFHVTMYDNLPYQRDSERCGAGQLGMYSGHILKYYYWINQKEPYQINNRDAEIEHFLAAARAKHSTRIRPSDIDVIDDTDGITQEQIQTLLEDNEQYDNNEENLDVFPDRPTVDAFADVEDW